MTLEGDGKIIRISAPRQSEFLILSDKYQILLTIFLLFMGLLQSCSRGEPESVADTFMDSYYATANLANALALADGLAARKIQDQQLLLKGQAGPQTMPGRRVRYERTETNTVDGKLYFRYEVRIDVQGGDSFTRKTLLALGHGPNGWRVTNFSETD